MLAVLMSSVALLGKRAMPHCKEQGGGGDQEIITARHGSGFIEF
jgi:hypothetical protein